MLNDVWNRIVLYVPLVMMGALALAAYWLVHTVPQSSGLATQVAVTHTPDYFMTGFSLRSFDATGRVRSEVLGDAARHYPDTQWLEIDRIRIKTYDRAGRLTTAIASRGLTNEDTSEVQLLGSALVVREPVATVGSTGQPPAQRMEYRGEFLHAFTKSERLISHLPVELTRGNDHFTADTMDYDNGERTIVLRGKVRGQLSAHAP